MPGANDQIPAPTRAAAGAAQPASPFFSLVIPAYNAESTLAETLDSVLAQTFPDFEAIVVNDGSLDRTHEIAASYAERDPRIRVVDQGNGGTGSAYNTGVRHARAEWVMMLSADDLITPEHMATYHAALTERGAQSWAAEPGAVGIVTSGGVFLYEDGTTEPFYPELPWAGPDGVTLAELIERCFIAVGAAYPRALWEAIGGFKEDLYAEDYLFFLEILARGYRHLYLPEPLAVHRRHRAQKSANGLLMRRQDREIVSRLAAAYALAPADAAAAHATIARLTANIERRTRLYAIFGASRSERLLSLAHRVRTSLKQMVGR